MARSLTGNFPPEPRHSIPTTAEAKRLFALEKLAEKVYLYREALNEPSRGMGAKVYWARDEMFKVLDELEAT